MSIEFEAVLFDMDGTLIDTEPYWLTSEVELMARYNVPWSEKDQHTCLGGPLDRVGQYMSDLAGGAESAAYFEHTLVDLVATKFAQGIHFMPGSLELLTEIYSKGIPLGLVSASPRILVDSALEALPFAAFSISVSSTDVTRSKPDPEGYLKAAEALGVDIENSLILEDSATGITAANSSGAFVLAIPHIVQLELNEKSVKVESLACLSYSNVISLFDQLQQQGAYSAKQ